MIVGGRWPDHLSGATLVVAMLDMRALPSAAAALSGLTEREQVVLRLVAEGLSPRDIADRVDLSEGLPS